MRRTPRSIPPARAFTLVEVLLTTVLAAVLLSVLWTMLSMHLRLFTTGQTRTEQSQLARTLLHQLSNDLHDMLHVVPAPPMPPPAQGLPMVAAPSSASPSSSTSTNGSTSSASSSPKGSPSAPPAAASAASSSPAPTADAPPMAATGAASPPPAAASTPNSNSSSASGPASKGSASEALKQQYHARGGPRSAASSPTASTSSFSLRAAGLFGSETHLQIDVCRAAIVRDDDDAEFAERPRRGVERPSRAAELVTVVYSFEEQRDLSRPMSEPHMVLVRREIPWEKAHPGTGAARRAGRGDSEVPLVEGDDLAATQGEATEVAPEVVQFGLRYFDGSLWTTEWDSAARKGLPVAVEVAMQLRSFDEPEVKHHFGTEATPEDILIKQPKLPTYRLLVHVPAAAKAPGGRDVPGRSGKRSTKPPLADTHGARG